MLETAGRLRTDYIRPMSALTRADADRAGAKAANLGELKRAGFPVPDGFVLTADAFDRFLADSGLDATSPSEAVAAAALPPDVADALRSAARLLGDTPLAVRSSAVAEDLPGASFAGQYETVLDVRGDEALLTAVRRCWASAFGARVAAYRAAREQGGVSSVAVLVQHLVPADAAGVAFTANPVTGDPEETVVNAVHGLGDRLVSGEVTPDEWRVRGAGAVCRQAPEQALDAGEARAVAELARRVEAQLGYPQDVEWALAGGEIFLLQARPITARPAHTPAPVPVPVEVPPGFWRRETTHYPEPISPAFRWWLPLFNRAIRRAFAQAGMLIEGADHREIGGWVYLRLTPLCRKDAPALPPWLVRLLMPAMSRLVPALRARLRTSVEAMRADMFGASITRWYQEWLPAVATRLADLRAVDLASLSDDALDEHINRLLAFFDEVIEIHGLLALALMVKVGAFAFTCRDLLGWDERRTLELLSGLSEMSTEPARRLAELTQMARAKPSVRALLAHVDDTTSARLASVDAEFADAFAAYQREFGCRALRYEVVDPTVAERPALVLGLIRDQLARDYNPAQEAERLQQRRAAVLAEARAALARRPAADHARFERTLAEAEQAYPVRENNEFYTVSQPYALARYALLEIGRRLAERGQITHRDDTFWLELDEARRALRAGGDQRAAVERRRAERAWVDAHPGPAAYGNDPGPPPPLDWMPPEARLLNETLLWLAERDQAPEQSERRQEAGAPLTGIAASPGTYTGPVRVIRSETEFGKIQAGDVLVCPITSPVWSVLFPSVGALVTDKGGILSHSAIIAREYSIPAVLATGNATDVLHDGQIVTVDGATGRVEVRP